MSYGAKSGSGHLPFRHQDGALQAATALSRLPSARLGLTGLLSVGVRDPAGIPGRCWVCRRQAACSVCFVLFNNRCENVTAHLREHYPNSAFTTPAQKPGFLRAHQWLEMQMGIQVTQSSSSGITPPFQAWKHPFLCNPAPSLTHVLRRAGRLQAPGASSEAKPCTCCSLRGLSTDTSAALPVLLPLPWPRQGADCQGKSVYKPRKNQENVVASWCGMS